jgi:Kef-type K+ transport system membrane component KefB
VARLPVSQGLLSFIIVVMLLYGWAAEVLGSMAAITGAFMAGLIFSRSPVKERVQAGVSALAYGLFVPVFFINVGLTANLRELAGPALGIFLATTMVAVFGKIIGAGLGGLWSGLPRREALQLGIGMVSRGEVGLIVASVGVGQGLITHDVFSALVGVIILTTLLTPAMLRWAFK